MTAYTHVLLGADGDPTSRRTTTMASWLAAALDVPLVVITAWDDTRGSVAYQWARQVTTDAAERARELGVRDIVQHEPTGVTGEMLIQAARERAGSLLVIGGGSLQRVRDRITGTTAHVLSHHSPVDLLAVQENGPLSWSTIGVATDGSSTANTASSRGIDLARGLDIKPTLLTVAKTEDEGERALSSTVASLENDRNSVNQQVLTGPAAKTSALLIDAACDLDLLVIGTRRMEGPTRLLGSVANRISHQLPTDLLLVRTDSADLPQR